MDLSVSFCISTALPFLLSVKQFRIDFIDLRICILSTQTLKVALVVAYAKSDRQPFGLPIEQRKGKRNKSKCIYCVYTSAVADYHNHLFDFPVKHIKLSSSIDSVNDNPSQYQ